MAAFGPYVKRIEALLALVAPKPTQPPLKLPTVILSWPSQEPPGMRDEGYNEAWLGDYDALLASIEEDEIDAPGWAERNAQARLKARQLRIPYKVLYGFSPEDGIEFAELDA